MTTFNQIVDTNANKVLKSTQGSEVNCPAFTYTIVSWWFLLIDHNYSKYSKIILMIEGNPYKTVLWASAN